MKIELKSRFSEAVRLRDAGDYAMARKALLDLSEEEPTSPAIFSVLGDVCWDMQLLDEAVCAFRRAVRLAPALEGASLGLFNCLWEQGKQEEAAEEVRRFMSISDSEEYRKIVKETNEK